MVPAERRQGNPAMMKLAREIIQWGKLLFERRLVAGWGGNMSCRIGRDRFLITGQHAPLGFLAPQDLVEVDSTGRPVKKSQKPSSETPLHLAVYRGTGAHAVIHAHPSMVLAFSLSHKSFMPISFEEKYTLGEVPILPQETPTVTETERVVDEMSLHPIVILQGHGTVAVGRDLKEAFLLTDLLEEAVRCQFFNHERSSTPSESNPGPSRGEQDDSHALFSKDHMAAMIDRANKDPQFQSQATETDLTTTLTLHLEDTDTSWTVHFNRGKITRLEADGSGEFVIGGKRKWWEAVFQKRIDPFLATQQGKLKLKRGELWRLSQWFKPFQRAFTLWQSIPIK